MTTHYNIEVIKTATHFKATYRNGKFRKLEHLRGKIDKPFLQALGKIIPLYDKDFGDYNKLFEGKVNYSVITQEKSLYSQFLEEWNSFYTNYTSIPPKFTGTDGKALKSIITYLKRISASELEALELWKIILNKWNTLNDFHRANTDLKYINSKLNIIINAVKKANGTYTSGTDRSVEL